MSTPCQQRNAREACTGTKSVTQANCLAAELVVGPSVKISVSKHADKFTKQTKMSSRVRDAFKNAGMIPCMSNVLVVQGGDCVHFLGEVICLTLSLIHWRSMRA